MTTTKRPAIAFHSTHGCYACDDTAVGYRDRRPEGGRMEHACTRHADPKIRVFEACVYCDAPVRKGSLFLNPGYAHRACHQEASR